MSRAILWRECLNIWPNFAYLQMCAYAKIIWFVAHLFSSFLKCHCWKRIDRLCFVSYFELCAILKKIWFAAVLFSIFSWIPSLKRYSLLLPIFYFQVIGCTLNPSLYTILTSLLCWDFYIARYYISFVWNIVTVAVGRILLETPPQFLLPITGFPSLSLYHCIFLHHREVGNVDRWLLSLFIESL